MATRVLLVDDDQKIISLLKRGLAYEGFEVYTAADGEAGLTAAKKYQPHLVLLDIAMPGLDGLEVARMRAVLRRHTGSQEMLTYSDLELNQATREVRRDGHLIELTMREYDLLLLLLRHPRQVLTRDQILEQVWGYNAELETNVLEVHMGHLRQKLEASGGLRVIQTIRGVGYVLKG